MSSSFDSLGETLVDISHKTLKDFEKEIVDNDELLNIFSETKLLIKQKRYNNGFYEDLKKEYRDKIKQVRRNNTHLYG